MASITTKHDKDMSSKILIMPGYTFYGALAVAFKLADAVQLKSLRLAFPREMVDQRTSTHDKAMATNTILTMEGMTFYAAMLSLIFQADTDNLLRLEHYFPTVVFEAKLRYYSPDACISIDEWKQANPELDVNDDLLIDLFAKAQHQASLQ